MTKPRVSALPARSNLLCFPDHPEFTDRSLERHLATIAEDNMILFELGFVSGHPYTWDAVYKFDPPAEDGQPQEVWGNSLDVIQRKGEDCDGWASTLAGYYRHLGRDASPMIYPSAVGMRHAVTWVAGPPPDYTHGPLGLALRAIIVEGEARDLLTGERLRLRVPTRNGFMEDPARAMGMIQVQDRTQRGEPPESVYRDLLAELGRTAQRFSRKPVHGEPHSPQLLNQPLSLRR